MPKCPDCGCCFDNHPRLCIKQNAETAFAKQISSIVKDSQGKRYRDRSWEEIKKIVLEKPIGEKIYVKEILDMFKTNQHSSGDIYRHFLDLLVCFGYLTKEFKPKGHIYIKVNNEEKACDCFQKKLNKKGKEKYFCSFDFIKCGVVRTDIKRNDFKNE